MALSKPDVKKKLSRGLTRPLKRTPGETLHGVFTIAADGTSKAGKYYPASERDDAVEYYKKHRNPESSKLYQYDPDTEFLVFFTGTVDGVESPPQHAGPDTELRMRLTDIEFNEYHPPTTE